MLTDSHLNNHSNKAECRPNTQPQVWIACSGGRDSMVLAHIVYQLYLSKQLPFLPRLIHVNHGLQHANDDWEKLVEQWAAVQKIPCTVVHANLKGTNEQAARQARYKAIMTVMDKNDVLLLAHHANDQAETLLMRLCQGAGVTGLSAMQAWTRKTATDNINNTNNKHVYLWRPLLLASRQQITEYAKKHALPYVDDPTNIEGDNIRSGFRRQLFPTIVQLYPQAIKAMSRSSQLFGDANNILTEVFQADLVTCYVINDSIDKYCEVLDIDKLQMLSSARQSQLIHRWVQGDETTPPSYQRVQEILALINRTDNDQQTQLDWQGQQHRYSIRRYRQQLFKLRAEWLLQICREDTDTDVNNHKLKNLIIKQAVCQLPQQNGFPHEYLNGDFKDCVNNDVMQSLSIRHLLKEDKIKLNKNGSSKAGKKLMQSLAIPSWERVSVKVVSVKNIQKDDVIAIISARFVWFLPDFSGNKPIKFQREL